MIVVPDRGAAGRDEDVGLGGGERARDLVGAVGGDPEQDRLGPRFANVLRDGDGDGLHELAGRRLGTDRHQFVPGDGGCGRGGKRMFRNSHDSMELRLGRFVSLTRGQRTERVRPVVPHSPRLIPALVHRALNGYGRTTARPACIKWMSARPRRPIWSGETR